MMMTTGDDIRDRTMIAVIVAPAMNAVGSNPMTTAAVRRAVAMMTMTAAHPAVAGAGMVTRKDIAKRLDRAAGMTMTTTTAGGHAVEMMTTTTAAGRGRETTKAMAVGLATPEDMLRLPVVDGTNGPRVRGAAWMTTMTTVAGPGRMTMTTRDMADGLATRAATRTLHGAVGKIGTVDS